MTTFWSHLITSVLIDPHGQNTSEFSFLSLIHFSSDYNLTTQRALKHTWSTNERELALPFTYTFDPVHWWGDLKRESQGSPDRAVTVPVGWTLLWRCQRSNPREKRPWKLFTNKLTVHTKLNKPIKENKYDSNYWLVADTAEALSC